VIKNDYHTGILIKMKMNMIKNLKNYYKYIIIIYLSFNLSCIAYLIFIENYSVFNTYDVISYMDRPRDILNRMCYELYMEDFGEPDEPMEFEFFMRFWPLLDRPEFVEVMRHRIYNAPEDLREIYNLEETIGLTAPQFAEMVEEDVDFKNEVFSFLMRRFRVLRLMEIYRLDPTHNNPNPSTNMDVYREAARIAFAKVSSNDQEHIM